MPVRVHMEDKGRMVNHKTKTDKTKTDTNPIPDPNRYRMHCPGPNARIQKFYTLYRIANRVCVANMRCLNLSFHLSHITTTSGTGPAKKWTDPVQ